MLCFFISRVPLINLHVIDLFLKEDDYIGVCRVADDSILPFLHSSAVKMLHYFDGQSSLPLFALAAANDHETTEGM